MTGIVSNFAALARELRKAMNEEAVALLRRKSGAAQAGALAARDELRRQVIAGGVDAKLAKTWRYRVFPGRGRLAREPTVMVWSNAPRIMQAAEAGGPIRPVRSRFLAIPLPAAVKYGYDRGDVEINGRFRRRNFANIKKAEERFGKLRAVPDKDQPGAFILFADNVRKQQKSFRKSRRLKSGAWQKGNQSLPLFKLVPEVPARRYLDVRRAATAGLAAIERYMATAE